MKIFSIVGTTLSGKTTTIENIIRELRNRGYSLGSVKEIHYEQFQIDTEGTNTYRHRQAGSQLVTARGFHETDVLFQEKLDIERILSFYDHDYVVLEGVTDANVPKIITAHNEDEAMERLDDLVFAISGKLANTRDEFNGIPVISSIDNIEKLVNLIEEKAERRDDTVKNSKIKIEIDGKEIGMVPFVQDVYYNVIMGLVKELKGYKEGGKISISIDESSTED